MTDTHRSVLILLSKGLRNSEIANHLGLTERTIKGYVSQLLLFYDVTNRTELVGLLIGDALGDATANFPSERAHQ